MKQTISQQLNIKDFPFFVKDKNDRTTYFETNDGYWFIAMFDKNDTLSYYENMYGVVKYYRSDKINEPIEVMIDGDKYKP